MKTLEKTIGGRKFTLNEDGTVYAHPFTDASTKRRQGRTLSQSMSVGYVNSYAIIEGRSVAFGAHRVIAEVVLPDWDNSLQVDHINGDKSDNRAENLRMVTCQQNNKNFKTPKAGISSRFRGVGWHKKDKRWSSSIYYDGKQHFLGNFKTEEAAAIFYDREAAQHGFSQEALNLHNYPEISLLFG